MHQRIVLLIILSLFICNVSCINEGFTFFGPTLGMGGGITSLLQRQCVLSAGKVFSACMLDTGNFVVINQAAQSIDFSAGSDVVAMQIGAKAPFRAVMQGDNNFVVLGGQGQVLFQSTVINVPVFLYLAVTDAGTIQLQDIAGNVAWTNGIINQAGIQSIGIFAGRTGYQLGLGGPNFGGVNIGGLLPMKIFGEDIIVGEKSKMNQNNDPALMAAPGDIIISKLYFGLIISACIVFSASITGMLCVYRKNQLLTKEFKSNINTPHNNNQPTISTSRSISTNQANPPQIRPRLSQNGQAV
jgi:hypothetical protein